MSFRSGYIAIVGRPNVGKSTLLNQLLGTKVAIVTPKPQTTRNRITGIRTTADSQMVFVDTPGIHRARSLMNRRMVDVALQTLQEVDGVLWLVDAQGRMGPEDESIAQSLRELKCHVLILLNKIDLVAKRKLLPLIERCAELVPGKEIVPISALNGENLPLLLELVEKNLPEGPRYFPEGEFTDQTERFIAAEIVREKVFLLTREEIPYGVAVTIDEFTEKEEKNLIVIQATLHTEREAHKPILIGKKGAMLKEIGQRARQELEVLLGCRIFLELFIRVDEGWTRDPRSLAEMGL
jgi:GTPase